MSTSTIANRVNTAFTLFAVANKSAVSTTNVLTGWNNTYAQRPNTISILEIIGQLSRSIRLLQTQIAGSKLMPLAARNANASIVGSLSRLLDTTIIFQPIANHVNTYSAHHLGLLESAAVILAIEYPEPDIESSKAEQLFAELNDIANEIRLGDFDPSIKALLGDYISFLTWAITNKDSVGTLVIREISASIILGVKEATIKEKAKTSTEHGEKRLSVLSRLEFTAFDIIRIAFSMDVLGHGLIDFAKDAGTLLIPGAS